MSTVIKNAVTNAGGNPIMLQGLDAALPVAGIAGRLYVATDTLLIYRDNGSSWAAVGGAGATPDLEDVTTVGNSTTQGITVGNFALGDYVDIGSDGIMQLLNNNIVTTTIGNSAITTGAISTTIIESGVGKFTDLEAFRVVNSNGFFSFFTSDELTRIGYLQFNFGGNILLSAENAAQIVFGGAPVVVLNQSITADTIIKNAGIATQSLQADGSVKTLDSGTYTPNLTPSSNCAAVALVSASYSRVGNVVTASILMDVTPTIGGLNTGVQAVSLPVSFGTSYNRYQATGVAYDKITQAVVPVSGFNSGSSSTTIFFVPAANNVQSVSIQIIYSGTP